jgi:integrase
MATFRKVCNSWEAQVYITVDGERKRKSKTFKLKAKATEWAYAMEAGKFEPDKHLFSEALEKYEQIAKNRWELIRIKKFSRELEFASKPIATISPADIAKWRDSSKLQGSSIRREMVLLNAVFEIARKEWQWIDKNPLADVKRPPDSPYRKRLITLDEFNIMADTLGYDSTEKCVTDDAQVALCMFIAEQTGMRSGEIVSLEWNQVDLVGRKVHLTKTKNGDDRDVPLTLKAVDLFKQLVKTNDKCFSITDSQRDFLFRSARKAAGLSGFVFHDTRHNACTWMAKKVDNITLAKIMGHRNPKSLMVYYNPDASDIAPMLD